MENIFTDLIQAFSQLLHPIFRALAPLLVGLSAAWMLSPVVNWLEPRTGKNPAIAITYLTLFAGAAGLLYGFVFLIIGTVPTGSLTETAELVMNYFRDASASVSNFLAKYAPVLTSASRDPSAAFHSWLSRRLSLQSMTSLFSALTEAAVSFFLGLIASIYLIRDRDFFLLLWQRFLSLILPQKAHGMVCEIAAEINQVLTAFLKGALIDSLIVAFLSSAALSLLRVDFAVVLGVFSGILNIIPYFGPFIGMIPAFLAGLFGGGLSLGLAAAAALLLVQQLDSNFIYPHIVGSSTGLHPLFILLAVSTSGYLFGLAGMLLAVPTAGIIQILISQWACR